MATYYVDFVNGLDANNGLGPDASAGTNKPWKTIAKLLGAAGMASGDTAYLSPAGPFREVVTVAMTSATAETLILGDPLNVQGFKTSGGVAVAPGPVIWTAYTTNDKTAPSTSSVLTLAGRDNLTFQNILCVFGNSSSNYGVDASTTDSVSIKFTDCAFLCGHQANKFAIKVTASFGTALNWTIDRCLFVNAGGAGVNGSALFVTCATGTGADYDVNILFRNSFCQGVNIPAIFITNSGASANKGNGVKVSNCFFVGAAMGTTATNVSTSIASTVNNSFFYSGSNVGLNAGTAGQITENYNLFSAGTPRTNVTAGANSISDGSYAPLFNFGQERIWGSIPRPYGMPLSGSPLLAFGNDGTQTSYDLQNYVRILGTGALAAVGAMEYQTPPPSPTILGPPPELGS